MTSRIYADKLIKGINAAKKRAEKSPKATAAYWNCDNWGSCSGMQDADTWVKDYVRNWVMEFVEKNKDSIQ